LSLPGTPKRRAGSKQRNYRKNLLRDSYSLLEMCRVSADLKHGICSVESANPP
jgi:hypothetical protein